MRWFRQVFRLENEIWLFLTFKLRYSKFPKKILEGKDVENTNI